MRVPREPVFLERQSYRRRRLMDAARLLPVLGAVLFAFPILWSEDGAGPATADAGLYLFAVWALLILAARLLAPRLTDSEAPLPPAPEAPPEGG